MCVQIHSAAVCKEFSCNVATCCCRSLLVQVSLHYALFHRVGALPVILNPFILLTYQVLLHKVQTSHVAWNQLWQPGVTSRLGGLDWQVICQPDSGRGVCVFVDFCDANVQTLSTANMNLPSATCFSKTGKIRIPKIQDFLEIHSSRNSFF